MKPLLRVALVFLPPALTLAVARLAGRRLRLAARMENPDPETTAKRNVIIEVGSYLLVFALIPTLMIALPPAGRYVLEVADALRKLESQDPRKAELVRMRFFAGLTLQEAARALGISTSTADNDWAYAKTWLKLEMAEGDC